MSATPSIEPSAGSQTNLSLRNRSGINFDVASHVEDVVAAWELVYQSYLRAGLIDANPEEIHTVSRAIHPGTAVIVGRMGDSIVSTVSGYLDRPGGLPMDAVYRDELTQLRQNGHRLMEVGLLADRREQIARSVAALLELMRHIFFYAVHSGATDMMIGVHPDHAGFYRKCFAFEPIGDVRGCPAVKEHPMVPLRLDLHGNMLLNPLPKGMAYFKANPLGPEAFANRLSLDPSVIANSRISRYLQELRLKSAA